MCLLNFLATPARGRAVERKKQKKKTSNVDGETFSLLELEAEHRKSFRRSEI